MKLFGKTVMFMVKPVDDDSFNAKLIKKSVSPLTEEAVRDLCAAIKAANLNKFDSAAAALSPGDPAVIKTVEVLLTDGTKIGISTEGVPLGLTVTDADFYYTDVFNLV
ncbi:MAG: hypothetical protein JRM72_01345 [Nitrososphaerota archaeon]|nr:hypothetical protein [Nitrososphaerota archaeon]